MNKNMKIYIYLLNIAMPYNIKNIRYSYIKFKNFNYIT